MGKSDSDEEHEDMPMVAKKVIDLKNSSIKAGKEVIATVAGPIREWLPIPENLPKHPTMISDVILCCAKC